MSFLPAGVFSSVVSSTDMTRHFIRLRNTWYEIHITTSRSKGKKSFGVEVNRAYVGSYTTIATALTEGIEYAKALAQLRGG